MYFNKKGNSFCDVKQDETDVEIADEAVAQMFAAVEGTSNVIAADENGQPVIMSLSDFRASRNLE